MFFKRSKEKEFKMIWEVKKADKRSHLAGTAHFFPHSFKTSLANYIRGAKVVLFEGPLDKENMSKVVAGGSHEGNQSHIFDELDQKTIDGISEALIPACANRSAFLYFNLRTLNSKNPIYEMVKGMKPWMAFFTIWTNYLDRNGWKYSVDYEAYCIAREMGKRVVFLETIEEQIGVLEAISQEKIISFLKEIERWPEYAEEYVKCYLDGNLEELKLMWGRYPTRHPRVINDRDQIFYDRMKEYLEEGDALTFVGAPHIRGINELLLADGYESQNRG